jgi:UPF0755 protein
VKRTLLTFVTLAVVGGIAAALVVSARFNSSYKGYAAAQQFVEIPAGTAVDAIGRRLVEAGVVRDRATFRFALWVSGSARRLQAGEYLFDRPMTALEVVDTLARGDVFLKTITFREGLTLAEMARVFEDQGFGPARAFLEAASNVSPVATLDPEARDLEGYLFPETYSLSRGTDAATLVSMMVRRFLAVFDDAMRRDAVAAGRTVREAVTLASLVERETARADERPIVAAVYANRLRIGMGLQCDPTVIYALQRAGRYTGNLTRADLEFDSPYNTYRYAGLPPGPIAAPGLASLQAAVRPASVPYLYFVSRNDGSHVFASTLEEHNRNVQQYQVLYFRERRRRAATDDD